MNINKIKNKNENENKTYKPIHLKINRAMYIYRNCTPNGQIFH